MMLHLPVKRCALERRGFSFLEVLIASIFLMLGIVFLFSLITSSNQGTLDSYRETIAYCLATEELEWVAGLGYDKLVDLLRNAGNSFTMRFKPGEFVPVANTTQDDGSSFSYPEDFKAFKRMVRLTHHPDQKVLVVEVTVQPIDTFLRRESVILTKVVGREYD